MLFKTSLIRTGNSNRSKIFSSMLNKLTFFSVALLLLTVSGCAQRQANRSDMQQIEEQPQKMQLLRTQGWQLESRFDKLNQRVPAQPPITLIFEQNRLAGQSGCNHYFADYRVDHSRITIDNVGSTMMACSDVIMQQEQAYLSQLKQITSYQIIDNQLQLLDPHGKAILFFSPIIPAPLSGPTWRLSAFNTGNALLSNSTMENITALFDNNGKIQGFAGCNRYFGSYQSRDQRIEISALATTRKHCATPSDAMQTETLFISLLGNAVRFDISGNRLTLFDAKGRKIAIFNTSH